MVLILEDRRFFKHGGVDLKSVCRESFKACLGRRHGGASTIDMQFVRTVTGYRERTIKRKIYEIFLASLIQIRYSKIVILRSYLQCAFLGSHLRGVHAASLKIFNKPSMDLSLQEAATIAAMLVYPRPMKPTDEWNLRVQRRADYGQRVYISTKQSLEKKPSRKPV
ncbi:biosynthetic peptidoglycan transglycosylase [Herbaspirillum sp. B65]|uniref:biosynthetic peptidoglycan transglycosylase n=1 Tax=Herbaspirillum sp. B65 TaxID=137708 RepID=UPI0035B51634